MSFLSVIQAIYSSLESQGLVVKLYFMTNSYFHILWNKTILWTISVLFMLKMLSKLLN